MNSIKTALLLSILTVLLVITGGALGGRGGMVMAFVFACVLNFGSWWFSDKIILKMYNAKQINENEAPHLFNVVMEVSKRAMMPMPKIYIINDSSPNAFATGRNPEHAAVAVTNGILNLLSNDELKGVIAHELAHIKNHDTLISSIVATIAGAISMLASMARWGMMFGGMGRNDKENDSNPIASILVMILAPIAAFLIQMAISR
ncbi:M48 family metalloprotease, partial [Candidatus Desantisbacteria bacterium]|nr:M48 family metalloprotease [Candidatus Desantisbacteria bacterium]